MNSRPMNSLTVRRARVTDVPAILELINGLAREQVMLPRSPMSVYEGLRDFMVAEDTSRDANAFVGCGSLHVVWADLAEVRSLAVRPDARHLGAGRALIDQMVEDALALEIPTLFAFTYVPEFFRKLGFDQVTHDSLPHKVFGDCLNCPKFTACDEIAMRRRLREPTGAAVDSRLVADIPVLPRVAQRST